MLGGMGREDAAGQECTPLPNPAAPLPDPYFCCAHLTRRSYDALAPIMHEWTYEAMVHDLLDIREGHIYWSVSGSVLQMRCFVPAATVT